jgi:hypothetical protein
MRALAGVLLVALGACSPTEEAPLARLATVTGTVAAPEGVGGAAWLFLYRSHQGPPGTPAVPVAATAVSALRRQTDPRFVFAQVEPNPYRLLALLDVDGNFDPQVDVLAQAGAGDRLGQGVELEVQPGKTLDVDCAATTLVTQEPPAFHLVGAGDDVSLDQLAAGTTPLTLEADDVGHLNPARTAFSLGLVDADGDGRPDDANGDGVADLSLQLLLHWLPLPGQAPPGTVVVVPLVFDPSPFVSALGGNLQARTTAQRLQAGLVAQGAEVTTDSAGKVTLSSIGSPPAGAYELVALGAQGQFWRLPNQLGTTLSSQRVSFHFDRTAP